VLLLLAFSFKKLRQWKYTLRGWKYIGANNNNQFSPFPIFIDESKTN